MLIDSTTRIETMCPYVAYLRSNQNNGGVRSVNAAQHATIRVGGRTVALYLYVAVSVARFKSLGHFWMSSKSKNTHRVLLRLGLAPAIMPAALPTIKRIIKGMYDIHFFLNNTFSIDKCFTAVPHDSVQKRCDKVLMTSLAHLFEEGSDKKISAEVIEILNASGIGYSQWTRKAGPQAGQVRREVTGISPIRSVAAWNYSAKLEHGLGLGDKSENSDSGSSKTPAVDAKRKPDDDDDDDKPAAKKGSIQSFFGKGKSCASRA